MLKEKHKDNNKRFPSLEENAEKDNQKRVRKYSNGRDQIDDKKNSNDQNIQNQNVNDSNDLSRISLGIPTGTAMSQIKN